jgi:hypothetical protein
MSSTLQDPNIHQMLQDLSYRMGRFSAQADIMADQMHTCKCSYLKHPWPPEEGCLGCEREIQKWVKRFHLEIPYRLFGWQCVVDTAERATQRKIDQAVARRNMGAGI